MNARRTDFELNLEGDQVEEVVSGLFHTILFHRTLGKFDVTSDQTYSSGSVGYEDVDCDFVNFTYVRSTSKQLCSVVQNNVADFSNTLRRTDGTGEIMLEFFRKKKTTWFLTVDNPWEIWLIRVHLIAPNNEHERQLSREKLEEVLADKVFHVAEAMNKQQFIPDIPDLHELDNVFQISYDDVQPYQFKISYSAPGVSSTSVASAMKKLVRESLVKT